MELKSLFVLDPNGTGVIPNATAALYHAGTNMLAAGLQDAAGEAMANPFEADADGLIMVAAPDGDYDLEVTGLGRVRRMRVRFRSDPIGKGVPILTEAGIARTASLGDAGHYIRFTNADAKSFTFDSAQIYSPGDEYHVRNVGAADLTLTTAGTFVLNPPADGTLVVPPGGTVTVKIVGAAEADVFGAVVPA